MGKIIDGLESIYSDMELKVLREQAEKGDENAKKMLEEEMDRILEENTKRNRADWLEKNGFNEEDGTTYIVIGETYPIREDLRTSGFRYSPILKWHRRTPSDEYKTIAVKVEEVANFMSWGTGCFFPEAQAYIEDKLAAAAPIQHTSWFGEVGDKICNIDLILVSRSSFTNKWNHPTYIYNFKDDQDHRFSWFTSKVILDDIGSRYKANATIKDLKEYKGIKTTVLKIKDLEPKCQP